MEVADALGESSVVLGERCWMRDLKGFELGVAPFMPTREWGHCETLFSLLTQHAVISVSCSDGRYMVFVGPEGKCYEALTLPAAITDAFLGMVEELRAAKEE